MSEQNGTPTYFDWLKTQSEGFQREAISGKQNAKKFTSGEMQKGQFDRLKIGKRFAPITMDEMKAKSDLIIDG